MTLEKKLNYLLLSAITLITLSVLIATYINIKFEEQALNTHMRLLETSIKNEYKNRLKESVENTFKFIDHAYNTTLKFLNHETEPLTEENRAYFVNEVRQYIYQNIVDKTRYTWVNEIINFDGGNNYAIRLIHPNLKDKEGGFLTTKAQDIKGNRPFLEELEGVKKEGEIYFTYYFKQLDSDEITEKLSYAKLHPKHHWVVATGISVNTLNQMILTEKNKLDSQFQQRTWIMMILSFIIVVIFAGIIWLFRNKIIHLLSKNIAISKKYQEALEATNDGLWEWDIGKGNVYFSPTWKTMLGYFADEIPDDLATWRNLIHPDDLEGVECMTKVLSQEVNTAFETEFRMRDKNGSYRWILCRAKGVEADQEGKPTRIIGTHLDIQKQKELEEQLKSLNEILERKVEDQVKVIHDKEKLLLQKNRQAAMGEMISMIAHQWRQPLGAIASSVIDMKMQLELKAQDGLGEKKLLEFEQGMYQTLTDIESYIQNLTTTIDDFRSFYKPDKKPKKCLPSTPISKSLQIVRHAYEAEGIIIVENVFSERSVMIHENEIMQVILNILKNAEDNFKEKNIEKPVIEIWCYDTDRGAEIEIYDNGGGIPEDVLSKIFDPYFSTKDEKNGTGLGLYMSKIIIEEHHKGKLTVRNKKGGACFKIKLQEDMESL